jgi:hypothetical protein
VDRDVVTDLNDMRKNRAARNILTACCLLEFRFKHDVFEMILRSTSTMADDILAKIEAKMLQAKNKSKPLRVALLTAKPSVKLRYMISAEPIPGARKVKRYDQLKARSRRTIMAQHADSLIAHLKSFECPALVHREGMADFLRDIALRLDDTRKVGLQEPPP